MDYRCAMLPVRMDEAPEDSTIAVIKGQLVLNAVPVQPRAVTPGG